jgi:hypothetical protein
MPDFAIIPELPSGYPINGRRSVARLVSVHTVVVSQTPAVVSPAVETGLFTVASLVGLPAVQPSDQFAQDVDTPPVSGVTSETGASSYVSALEVAQVAPSDQPAQDIGAPSVSRLVAENTSASVRVR